MISASICNPIGYRFANCDRIETIFDR